MLTIVDILFQIVYLFSNASKVTIIVEKYLIFWPFKLNIFKIPFALKALSLISL